MVEEENEELEHGEVEEVREDGFEFVLIVGLNHA